MIRLAVTLLLTLVLLVLVANAFEKEFEFENAVTIDQKELWTWRSAASGLKALHVDNSKGKVIIDVSLCLKKLKTDRNKKTDKKTKTRKDKETGKKIETGKNMETVKHKANEKNKEIDKVKTNRKNKRTRRNKKISVTVENIRFSNDGPFDQVQLDIGKTRLANFTTAGVSKVGNGWNEFLDSGKLGSTIELKSGTRNLTLTIYTDQYGVELDNIRMRFENQDPSVDVFCGSVVHFV